MKEQWAEEEEEEEEEDKEEEEEEAAAFFADFATLRKLVLELIFLYNGKSRESNTVTNSKNGDDSLPSMFCYK